MYQTSTAALSKTKRTKEKTHRIFESCIRWRSFLLAAAFVTLILPSQSAWAPPTDAPYIASALNDAEVPEGAALPKKGLKINIPRSDDSGSRVQGEVAWFTLDKVTYIDEKDNTQQQASWSEMDPKRLPSFLSSLPDRRDVNSLLTVAEIMIARQMPEDRIEHLFNSALRVDENAQERIDILRGKIGQAGEEPGEEGNNSKENPAEGNPDGQPDIDNPAAWPTMTKEQNDAAVEELKKFADDVLGKMNHKMGSTQTERFLAYSDMPKKESDYWIGVLDKMYDKLCETFDLDKDINIWRGKCLLLFFNSEQDYLKYNAAAYGNNASGSAGICYQFNSGDVHIAMYKQQNKKDLAHVLVHEAVHGFLFRYQSSHYIPNWLNEGLAEYIAVILADSGEYPGRAMSSRQFVKQRGSLDNFLSARNISGQHYGLAFDVTDLMVSENRKGYVKMIQGLKKGLSVEEAFDQEYGASIDRVFQYYGKSRLKMDNLKI